MSGSSPVNCSAAGVVVSGPQVGSGARSRVTVNPIWRAEPGVLPTTWPVCCACAALLTTAIASANNARRLFTYSLLYHFIGQAASSFRQYVRLVFRVRGPLHCSWPCSAINLQPNSSAKQTSMDLEQFFD